MIFVDRNLIYGKSLLVLVGDVFGLSRRPTQEEQSLVTLANEPIFLPGYGRGGIRVVEFLNSCNNKRKRLDKTHQLTSFLVHIGHHIDHVLHVLESLWLEMVQDLADQLFLSPDEKHAFPHDLRRDNKLPELLDPQPSIG